ncbi:hypothetical protein L6R52_12270 [Myxococcota bacterium]|nr:hypothetical protein [Myxococcota bacterium]
MSKCTRISFLALSALTLGLSVAACSSDRDNNGGTIRRKDSGVTTGTDAGDVTNPDSGTTTETDSGTGGTCNNPNCALHELQGAFPGCQCLSICEAGWVFNTGTRQCDPINGNPDGGVVTNPDSGTTTNPDAGAMPTNCTSAAQCSGTSPACIAQDASSGAFVTCSGQADCFCINSCNFDRPEQGCPQGERCTWLGADSTVAGQGACVPSSGGVAHGQSCQATYNGTQFTGDNCEVGNYCWGATSENPIGICVQFCNPQRGSAGCQSLGGYTCDDLGDPTSPVGLCLEPAPSYTDVGSSCASDAECDSNYCETGLGMGTCSATCDGLSVCPSNSLCLNAGALLCFRDCMTGGQNLCNSLNSQMSCLRIDSDGDNIVDFAVCAPDCTANTDCPTNAPTCNMTTGECQ